MAVLLFYLANEVLREGSTANLFDAKCLKEKPLYFSCLPACV
ncbi:hypothetical protein [Pontibacter rugosus]